MDKPRLVYVSADASKSGAPTQVSYLLGGLADDYELHLICPDGWLADQARRFGAVVHRLHDEFSVLSQLQQIHRYYIQIAPQIIHCHGVRGGLIGRLPTRPAGAKLVYTEHLWTADFHLKSPLRELMQLQLLQWMNHRTAAVVAVSETVRQFLLHRNLSSEDQTRVIYGGILPIESGAIVEKPIVGTLGQLTWVKGVDVLLRAVAEVKKTIPAIRCLIAGIGPDQKSLQKLGHILGIESQVEWVGEVADPTDFYHSLQLYIHPARSEAFGIAPLEAMSAGVSTIVSIAGALPEVAGEEMGRAQFRSENYHELAEIMQHILSDSQFRETIRAVGRERASHFSTVEMVAGHRSLYQEMIG